MKEKIFINKAKEEVNLEEFIRNHFVNAKCGNIEIQKTPIMTRIVLYTTTPGLIIGSGGERIAEITDILKNKFNIENPQIDVQKIGDPNLDPNIVAKGIASQLESGINYKRLGNFFLERIMKSGAIGCEIILSGKLSGERSRRQRFIAGYLKKCGEPAERDVLKGFAVANPRLGNIGVVVKIMLTSPIAIQKKVSNMIKKEEQLKEDAKKEKEASEQEKKDDVKKEIPKTEENSKEEVKVESKPEEKQNKTKDTPKEEAKDTFKTEEDDTGKEIKKSDENGTDKKGQA